MKTRHEKQPATPIRLAMQLKLLMEPTREATAAIHKMGISFKEASEAVNILNQRIRLVQARDTPLKRLLKDIFCKHEWEYSLLMSLWPFRDAPTIYPDVHELKASYVCKNCFKWENFK